MAKKKNQKPKAPKDLQPNSNIVNTAVLQSFQNGLTQALGFDNPFPSVQLSQVDTLFKNLRYYMLSNFRQILSQMYVEFGIVQTIIDMPVEDALRGGIEITTKELDDSEILDLHTTIERENDLHVVGQAMKYNRLYGGAGILILTDQDPMTELQIESITEDKRLGFHAVDMWELYYDQVNLDAEIIKPVPREQKEFDYYGVRVNRSRVMQLKGLTAPSFIRPRLRGWGFSVLEPIVRPINQFLKATDLAFEVLDEFKLDIYKFKNLASTLERNDGEAIVRKRIQLANMGKNYQTAVALDAEDGFEQKQISFTGISEAMEGIRMQLASETHFPEAKLFGTGSTGFSSGQDDIENYNAMIESQIRAKAKFDILRVVELRCQQKFGFIPEDLSITFKPLRVLSSEQEENVKNAKFTRLIQTKQGGECTTEEFKDGINKDKLLPIQLDTSIETLDVGQETKQESVTPVKKSKLDAKETKS